MGGFCSYRCKMFARELRFALIAFLACVEYVSAASNSTVILICLDGFRWDYMGKANTPNLDFIAKTGVHAPYVKNVFPTVTMPNLYTIVTGLYPESHGIIANEMFDPVYRAVFNSNNNETRWWDDGEPIWVTNQKHGFKSGTSFWPGFDVAIRGYFPSFSTNGTEYSKPFASKANRMPVKERIDTVIKWLTTDKPPTFVAIYFLQPDTIGREYGPDSPEIEAAIKHFDKNITGYLLDQLRQVDLLDEVNVIVTSDHGMTAYNTSNFINFDDIVNASTYEVFSGNKAFFTIQPHPGKESYVYDSLKEAATKTKLFEVYKKEDVPDDLHFKYNRRIGSIVGLLKEGWYGRSSKLPQGNYSYGIIRGEHGYSTTIKDMYPFFIARGPAFKQNFTTQPFEIIDIYPLICHILGIEPAPNNGSLARVKGLFKDKTDSTNAPTESTTEKQRSGNKIVKIAGFVILGFAGLVSLVASILLIIQWCKRQNRPKKLTWQNEEEDETAANTVNVDHADDLAANQEEPVENNDETVALRGQEIQV